MKTLKERDYFERLNHVHMSEEEDDVDGKIDYSCLWYNCTSMRS